MNKLALYFTPEELDYMFKVLAQRPFGEVQPLIANIQQQIQEQQNATANGNVQPIKSGTAG